MQCLTSALMLFGSPTDGWRPESIGYQDSEVRPVRCHWKSESHAERCAVVLEAAEEAWSVQVDQIGFYPPMPDEDGLLDIYLTNEGTYGGAYTYGPYEDEDTGDERMGCNAYIAIDSGIVEQQLPAYVAHEFNHVLQFATDFTEPTLPIWEATASASEVWTLGVFTPYYAWDFQAQPWGGLLYDSYYLWDDLHISSFYEYGAVLWMLHLDNTWGDGAGAGGVGLWEAATQVGWQNEPDVLDAYDAVTGDWREALLELSAVRARMGTEEAPEWLPGGASESMAPALEGELAAADLPAELSPELAPMQTGVSYWRLADVPAGTPLRLTLASETDSEWGLVIVEEGGGESWIQGQELTWEAAGGALTVGAVNFGASDFDADRVLQESSFTLLIVEDEIVAEDPGETGGGGGGGEEKGGCSTASGSFAGALAALGALLGRRRRAR